LEETIVRLIEATEFYAISGGEVGATGMGDNYHYTGEIVSRDDVIRCLGANGSNWIEAYWICLF